MPKGKKMEDYMKKKVLALVFVIALVAALTIGLVACDGGEDSNSAITYNLPALSKDTIKIGVLHINPTESTSGYTYAHEKGIKEMVSALGIDNAKVIREGSISDTNAQATKEAIDRLAAQGCNVIIGTSFGYQTTMLEMAKKYTNIYFSHGTGYMQNDNMNNYFGRIYQARYLSGIVAGLKTLEEGVGDTIGYVAAFGTEIAETCSGINAFALGAQSVNPAVKVKVKTLNSWWDPTNETAYATALLEDADCDIITQHCDTENPSAVAAKTAGKYSIGYNSDMKAAMDSVAGVTRKDSVLTSVLWNWGAYYKALVQAILNGEWTNFGNYYGGFEDGLFELAGFGEVASNTDAYLNSVKAIFNQGAAGRYTWDVFSGKALSFNTSGVATIVDKALKDNAGNVIIAAGGGKINDTVIQGSMNFFVEGVVKA